MCDCMNKLGQPMPNDLPWWAYLHAHGELMVHRWHNPGPGKDCDRCDAHKQKLCGNDMIITLVATPFWAADRDGALQTARKLLKLVGHRLQPEGLPEDPSLDRFGYII